MKWIFLIIVLFSSNILFAQEGVDFQPLTLEEALEKAKAEKKLVFADCYSQWCKPCVYMNDNIFPLKEAGDYFNSRFVCVKFDVGKKENKIVKKKYGISAVPVYLLLRPDGTVQHKLVGSRELSVFIEKINKGMNKKTSMLYLARQYETGAISKKEMLDYRVVLIDANEGEKAEEIRKELADKLTAREKLKKEYWPVFEKEANRIGSPDYNLLLTNLPVIEKNIGRSALDNYLYEIYSDVFAQYVGRRQTLDLSIEELKRQISGLDIPSKEKLLVQLEVIEGVDKGDVKEFLAILDARVPNFVGKELELARSGISTLRDKFSKSDYNRAANWLEKVLTNPGNKSRLKYLEAGVELYRISSYSGLYFQDLTLEQAWEKSEKRDRTLFIYCYTPGNDACQYMAENVFSTEKVGEYMNGRFVCVRYDIGKGDGLELAKKYGIESCPAFLILDKDGAVQHKFAGSCDVDSFIRQMERIYASESVGE